MKELLLAAREEIATLRRRNELLNAQVGVIEVFAAALGLRRNEGGMARDVLWDLDKEIAIITAAEPKEPK